MHPSEEIRATKDTILENKRIILGVTGSIAAVETVKLARELIRFGSEIIPVMTPAATSIIHPDALWFATGKKPIITLTGQTEHVSYVGKVKNPADLLLICPCTANTLSKIAHGIDDTAVTTFATTAIGAHHPVLIVPAMHQSMYDHPIIQENILNLKKLDQITIIDPIIKDNKAKLPSISTICSKVIRILSDRILSHKKILIIGGACSEPIDSVRNLMNKSSGKTAVALATEAYYQGADITWWYGTSMEPIPDFLSAISFQTIGDIQHLIQKTDMNQFDLILVCAALSDYVPERYPEKIESRKESLTISCKKTDKMLGIMRKKAKNSILVGFKLGTDEKDVIKQAQKLQKEHHLDYVVANTISSLNQDTTQSWLVNGNNIISFQGSKQHFSRFIFNHIISKGDQ